MADAPLLKDYFTADVVQHLCEHIQAQHGALQPEIVVRDVFDHTWAELTFTQRAQRIADVLWVQLDLSAAQALQVITAALPDELATSDGVLNDRFWLWPVSNLIATYTTDYPDETLTACYELTKRFTAEFAIRPVLHQYPEVLPKVLAWASDPNEHVRRLVSEGTRPRLPWAQKLTLPEDDVLAALAMLRTDPSSYVRRSVANNLNDRAKDNPVKIIALLSDWYAEGHERTSWIVRHALRNHLKHGTPEVMAIFGYRQGVTQITQLTATPQRLPIGGQVTIAFMLTNTSTDVATTMVDLVVTYCKARGKTTQKVFKYRVMDLQPHQPEKCTKSLTMANLSTRAIYPGEHTVTIRVNGEDLASTTFDITP